jgi:chromosome transmission fidelity protein 4
MPLTYDSCGILRGFLHSSDCWIPLIDTRIKRQGKQEYYWPVGVFEESFMCIICKGQDKFPPFPKPMIMEIPMSIPFLAMDAGLSGVAEEKHYRGVVLLENSERELEVTGERTGRQEADLKAAVVKKRSALDRDALHLHLVCPPQFNT